MLGTAALLGFGSAFLLLRTTQKQIKPRQRWLSTATSRLLQRPHKPIPSKTRLISGGAAVSAGVIATMALLNAILKHRKVIALDRHLHNFFRKHRTRRSEALVDATTKIGSTWTVLPASFIAAAGFFRGNDIPAGIAILWSVTGGSVLSETLKKLVRRKRPAEGRKRENDYSFPSGHTLLSGSLFGLLAYLLSQRDDIGPGRYPAVSILALLTPCIAFSRVYLGRHWSSDIVASAALATAWNATLITFLRSRQ